jgi:sialic acid synthase SpsE
MAKIKAITNENLIQYTAELKGNIILSIDNVKATDIETVSKLINNKEESQSVRLEMINKTEKSSGLLSNYYPFIKNKARP